MFIVRDFCSFLLYLLALTARDEYSALINIKFATCILLDTFKYLFIDGLYFF